MRWAKTLLCTLTHTSGRSQTDCVLWKKTNRRGFIWPVTFTPFISHLLCNVRIFFMGEEFPFIGLKCENQSYCPIIESESAWLQHNLHFHVGCLFISTKPAARITGSKGVGSAPGKIPSSPFLPRLPAPSCTKHSTHYPHRAAGGKSPGHFFQSAIWPSLASRLLRRIWPNIP